VRFKDSPIRDKAIVGGSAVAEEFYTSIVTHKGETIRVYGNGAATKGYGSERKTTRSPGTLILWLKGKTDEVL
jgi:hypothetical protein